MLAFLSLYNSNAAKSLVAKTVPWLREHQADDGLWHHEELSQDDWGNGKDGNFTMDTPGFGSQF